ncbi:MAG: hypothetical protein H8E59_01425 [Actinobacteria bacterium]|nr:hypothetical protein [Actinomycetota bacterium]
MLLIVASPANAQAVSSDEPQREELVESALGVLTIESDGLELVRTVRTWIRPDGVFRSTSQTTSGIGLGASEDVYGLGDGRQIAIISPARGVPGQATLVDNSAHYAIDGNGERLSEGFSRSTGSASVAYRVLQVDRVAATQAFLATAAAIEDRCSGTPGFR